MPGRRGKQCRDRYVNHLRPDIKRSEWTEEEERTLATGWLRTGQKWYARARSRARVRAHRPPSHRQTSPSPPAPAGPADRAISLKVPFVAKSATIFPFIVPR